jgi:hypothetical protein
MTKEEVDRFLELEDKIYNKADELLQWYRENIHPREGEDLHFEYIDENEIWYSGYDRGGDGCSLQLPLEMLYREEAKQEYIDKLEKEAQLKRHQEIIRKKEEEIKRAKAKYEQYLKLKEEFE